MLSVQPKTHPCLNSKDFKGEGERERGRWGGERWEGGGREERKRRGGSNFIQLFSNSIDRHTNSPPLGNLPAHYLKRICFPSLREVGWGGGGGGEKREKNNTYFPRPRLIHDQTCHSDWPSMNPWCSTGVTIYSVSWNTETYTFRLRNCKQRWNSATNKQNKCQHFMVVWVCLKKNFMIDLKSS